MQRPVELIPVADFPVVHPNDDIAELIVDRLTKQKIELIADDILVVAQKIVSKAECRYVKLSELIPSTDAIKYASLSRKDSRLVEAILRESSEVLRCRENLLVVSHRIGYVVANAAIDASNVGADDEVLLLPLDPDGSAERLRERIGQICRVKPGVIINDSFGRAWRHGTIGTAIGASGVASLEDLRGRLDLFGRTLIATEVATADQLASAASLLQGQADEGIPVVLIRGFTSKSPARPAKDLIRSRDQDAFR